MQVNCHIFTLCIFHQKGKKWQSFLAAGFFVAGVSGPWFFLLFASCVVRYWTPLRSITGGCPESPGGRSLRPVDLHRQRLRPGAESPPAPESPVPWTRVSGPSSSKQCVARYWHPVRRKSGGRPEFSACPGVSGPLRPESPAQLVSNGQKSWRGINTPPPTSGQPARPAFMNPNSQELKFARSPNSSIQTH